MDNGINQNQMKDRIRIYRIGGIAALITVALGILEVSIKIKRLRYASRCFGRTQCSQQGNESGLYSLSEMYR